MLFCFLSSSPSCEHIRESVNLVWVCVHWWLVGWFEFNSPLRQYFSLYWAISQRSRQKRDMIDEWKKSKQPPPAPAASAVGTCPMVIQISMTPRPWKFNQHHHTTHHPCVHWSFNVCYLTEHVNGSLLWWLTCFWVRCHVKISLKVDANEMAHNELPHLDLLYLLIQLFSVRHFN